MRTTYLIKNVFCRGQHRIKEFSDNHLLLLTYLQKFTTYQNKIYFVFDFMYNELKIQNKLLRKELYQCLQDLQNWGLINITNKVDFASMDKNTMIVLERVQERGNYTLLLADEVDKILYADIDIRQKRTMLYLYTIIEHRKYDKEFCFARRQTFRGDMQIKSNKRVQDGLNELKDLGLIDFANAGIIKDEEGKIYNSNNVYVTTYTPNYKDILTNAIEGNKEYHKDNNSAVTPKKEKATRNGVSVAEGKTSCSTNNYTTDGNKSQIQFDDKILNYEYNSDWAKMIVKHINIGMQENPIPDSTFRQYEGLKQAYKDEIEYNKRVEETQKKRALLKEYQEQKPIPEEKQRDVENEEDEILPWLKEVEENEKRYAELGFEQSKESILDVLDKYKDNEYNLPF